jgi:hypothetical protein
VSVSQVEVVSGTPPPVTPSSSSSRQSPGSPPNRPASHTSIRGFGHVGYGWFTAHKAFAAVFDRSGAPWAGGGVDLQLPSGSFVEASVERLRENGERVFVFDNTVTKMGIADTVTIVPVEVTLGQRIRRARSSYYVGAGFGRYVYREVSAFADPADKVWEHFASYHVMGGYEIRRSRWFGAAIEGQFTHVPNALTGNLAESFKEHNLGGGRVRVKIFVGK